METKKTLRNRYCELKAKHPDAIILLRIGDFYETYDMDAKICSNILGITLSWKKNNVSHDFVTYDGAIAAFPYHALDTYLPRLIRAGKRVAICDV